uniref:SET domain-containing protein n=1 Tax=Hemiselmis andersenii TaxID=464988 RepID=A0A6T8IF92_HEMAN
MRSACYLATLLVVAWTASLLLLSSNPLRRATSLLPSVFHPPLEQGYAIAEPWRCPATSELANLVRRAGGEEAGVAPMEFELSQGGTYRGLGATKSILEGEVAVAVPVGMSLSAVAAEEGGLLSPKEVEDLLKPGGLDEFSLLAAVLLLEAGNVSSRYRHYLCSLPRHIPLPYYQTPGEIFKGGRGRDSRFLTSILSAGTVLVRSYLSASAHLLDKRRDLFPSRPSFAQWCWASSVIMSRSWGVPVPNGTILQRTGTKQMHVLAPLADMVNHDAASRKVGVRDDGTLVVYAARNLSAKEEITITYGNKCNTELMASYGFEVPGNPRTFCEWDQLVAKALRGQAQPAEAGAPL